GEHGRAPGREDVEGVVRPALTSRGVERVAQLLWIDALHGKQQMTMSKVVDRVVGSRAKPRRDDRDDGRHRPSHSHRHRSKITGVPLWTRLATVSASQLVKRTQPCDAVWPISEGSGDPWMP